MTDLTSAFITLALVGQTAALIYISQRLARMTELAEKYRELWQEALGHHPPQGLVEQNRVAQWEQRRG